jgi:hypothetical protein
MNVTVYSSVEYTEFPNNFFQILHSYFVLVSNLSKAEMELKPFHARLIALKSACNVIMAVIRNTCQHEVQANIY